MQPAKDKGNLESDSGKSTPKQAQDPAKIDNAIHERNTE